MTAVLVAKAATGAASGAVVEELADNESDAVVELVETGVATVATEFELAEAHQKIPAMTATVMMPETMYMPEPVDVSPFM